MWASLNALWLPLYSTFPRLFRVFFFSRHSSFLPPHIHICSIIFYNFVLFLFWTKFTFTFTTVEWKKIIKHFIHCMIYICFSIRTTIIKNLLHSCVMYVRCLLKSTQNLCFGMCSWPNIVPFFFVNDFLFCYFLQPFWLTESVCNAQYPFYMSCINSLLAHFPVTSSYYAIFPFFIFSNAIIHYIRMQSVEPLDAWIGVDFAQKNVIIFFFYFVLFFLHSILCHKTWAWASTSITNCALSLYASWIWNSNTYPQNNILNDWVNHFDFPTKSISNRKWCGEIVE